MESKSESANRDDVFHGQNIGKTSFPICMTKLQFTHMYRKQGFKTRIHSHAGLADIYRISSAPKSDVSNIGKHGQLAALKKLKLQQCITKRNEKKARQTTTGLDGEVDICSMTYSAKRFVFMVICNEFNDLHALDCPPGPVHGPTH